MTPAALPNLQQQLKKYIRDIPDFPKKGVVFRDITPLLAAPDTLKIAITAMARPFHNKSVDIVVGAESRGFIFGTSVARELNCGFVPIRKKGKLPAETISQNYELEYGADQLEIHVDAFKPNQRILMVDDLLATGGTMRACCQLVQRLKGHIMGLSFLIELTFLKGRDVLSDYDINALIAYD